MKNLRLLVTIGIVTAVIVAIIVALLVAGSQTAPTGSRVTPGPSSSPTANGPSNSPAAAGALAKVHSPKAMSADINLAPGQCHARGVDTNAGLWLPDPACTPGGIDPAVTQDNIAQTICTSGYTATVRPPTSGTGGTTAFKQQSLADYGMTADKTIEYDHLVPLELGGANSVSNLWPQPNKPSATGTTNPKDSLENQLHDAVCSGRVTLTAAQQAIANDWTTALQNLGLR